MDYDSRITPRAPRGRSNAVLFGLAAAAASVVVAPTRTEAGIVAISRESQVRVQGTAGSVEPLDVLDESRSTTEFGLYDESVSGQANDPGPGTSFFDGSAEQQTSVGALAPGSFVVSGHLAAIAAAQINTVPGETFAASGSATSSILVQFSVIDAAEEFRFDIAFNRTGDNLDVENARIILTTADGLTEVFRAGNEGGNQGFTEFGLLEVGTYRLFAESSAFASEPATAEGSSTDFRFIVGDTAAIPLPPAVLSGGLGLLAAAWFAARSRRQRHRAA